MFANVLMLLQGLILVSTTMEKTTIIVDMINSKVLNYWALPLTYFYII